LVKTNKKDVLLSVRRLSVEYPAGRGRVLVLNDVSFDIGKGEVVALVGESGSGKTVTALSIMQLLPNLENIRCTGDLLFKLTNGETINLSKAKNKVLQNVRGKEIALVSQEPMSALNPSIPCGDQIIEAIEQHLKLSKKEAYDKCIELLTDVDIQDPESIFSRYPDELSGGQIQRIFIAMALASEPKLIIADEPTTALDLGVRRKVLEVLKRIKEKYGLSMLFITHDLELASVIADQVLVMYSGLIVEKGSVAEVFNTPKHPYTKGLINCRPPKDQRFYFLPTLDDFMRLSPDGTDLAKSPELEQITNSLLIHPEYRSMRHDAMYSNPAIMKVVGISKSVKTSKWFNNGKPRTIVDRVSFDLYFGETFGLIGASGCGKSTLARCISGLLTPDNGYAQFLSNTGSYYEVLTSPFELGKRVQYIFQDPYASLNPRMTIREILSEPIAVHKPHLNDTERVELMLELVLKVGLKPHHLQRYPTSFSGGQRQRISIARALLMDPKVIVCDEAVASLDVSVQAQVLNLLNELKYEYNLSYVFISHDPDIVRFMSDRIGVMKDGKLISIQDADELFNEPSDDYTSSLTKILV
jgi:peptide/nickel transport system ATP-binding protein